MSERKILALPKHANPSPARTASAPYNFVPLPEVVVRAVDEAEQLPNHDTYANEAYPYTGYCEVTLTTKSPLYVRCPFTLSDFLRQEREEDKDKPFRNQVKNTPHFFYTRDPNQPVIPGSSLRGMLRSLLEIVSYGKVQWVTDKKLFYRTVDTTSVGRDYVGRMSNGDGSNRNGYHPKVEGGLIRNLGGRWQIEKCTVARVEMNDVAGAFGVIGVNPQESKRNLYTDLRPNGRPQWAYQHKPVWVQTEPAERDHRHSNAYLRYLKVTSIHTAPSGHTGEREGVLVLTGPMPRQHMAFVFIPNPHPTTIDVPNDPNEEDLNKRLVERFHDDDQITRWQSDAFPDGRPTGAVRQRNGYLRDREPVFFLRESGQLTFFGRAEMFRLPYTQRPLDLVPSELRRPEDADYADTLFGFVRTRKELDDMKQRGISVPNQGSKARAYASRVSVTDATLLEGQTDIWFPNDPIIAPKILATPKPTAFQHYLTQQESNNQDGLDHYGSPPPHETVIRGHKRYWHQGTENGRSLGEIRVMIEEEKDRLREIAEREAQGRPDTQHTQFKPVKPEVQFRFRVYFENLSARELGALCWVLHPLGDVSKDYCHHLGMGKPLGMGGVNLDATLYLTDRITRYSSLFDSDDWQTGVSGPGSPLSDWSILERLTKEFEQHILGMLKPNKPCAHLSNMKRIAMLLKMLEWPGFPPEVPAAPGNRFLASQERPNTRHMSVQLPNTPSSQRNEYRNRPVLPDPSMFGSLTGDAEPATAATVPARIGPIDTPPSAQTGVTTRRELVTLVEDAKRNRARVETNNGEQVVCTSFPVYPGAKQGMRCRAAVTRQDGKPLRATFKRWE